MYSTSSSICEQERVHEGCGQSLEKASREREGSDTEGVEAEDIFALIMVSVVYVAVFVRKSR